jgi:hypothetical protein
VTEVIYVTGHLKEKVEDYARTQFPMLPAKFVEQKVQDGTAGAVKLAQPFVGTDDAKSTSARVYRSGRGARSKARRSATRSSARRRR